MTFSITHYEVHHFTLCEGWVNCWRTIDAEGREVPEAFATEAAAQAAIEEFLADIAADIAAGERDPEDGYGRDEFAVVAVSPS